MSERKVKYTLTIPKDSTATVVKKDDGSTDIVFTRTISEDIIQEAFNYSFDEFSGEYQSNMLWEVFEHDFEIEGAEDYYE